MKRDRGRQLRANRVALTVLGVVLIGMAATALLVSTGAVRSIGSWIDRSEPLLSSSLEEDAGERARAGQLIALGGGLVLVALGILWLRAVVPRLRHQQDLEVENRTDVAGRNVVTGGALANALRVDLESDPAVHRAAVEVRPEDGELNLTLTVEDSTDLGAIVSTVDRAAQRLQQLGARDDTMRRAVDLRLRSAERHLL